MEKVIITAVPGAVREVQVKNEGIDAFVLKLHIPPLSKATDTQVHNSRSPCAGSGWFCFQLPEESPGNGPRPSSGYYGNGVPKAEDMKNQAAILN